MKSARKLRVTISLMLSVLACISVAALVTPSICTRTIRQFEEDVLKQNLDTMRKTIDAYTYDKRKAPQSLDDLVSAGYLKKIPVDPITNQADWQVVTEDTMASIDQTEPGINDVHSASQLQSTEGTAYNTW